MNYYAESQLQKMSQLLEQKQFEINKLKTQLEKYQNYELQLEELNECIQQLNFQFQQQETQHKEQIYFMQRELAFAQEEIRNLQRTKGPCEQQQIASLLKELSDMKQENIQLKIELQMYQQKKRTNSIQEYAFNEIKRQSPQMRVQETSFVSPSQIQCKERRVPSLPDVSSNRLSITKTSFHHLQKNSNFTKKPPIKQILNISPSKQQLFLRL